MGSDQRQSEPDPQGGGLAYLLLCCRDVRPFFSALPHQKLHENSILEFVRVSCASKSELMQSLTAELAANRAES